MPVSRDSDLPLSNLKKMGSCGEFLSYVSVMSDGVDNWEISLDIVVDKSD
jgi:hypothetical protein